MKKCSHGDLPGVILGLVLFLTCSTGFAAGSPEDEGKAASMLRTFVEDYLKNDELPEDPLSFGLNISGPEKESWTILINKSRPDRVELRKGVPDEPTFYLVADLNTLEKIYNGELNALTAAGRGRMSDPAPLDLGFMEGFTPSAEFLSDVLLPLSFHFFNRGNPEVVRFGEEYSRNVHGANAVIFYYQQGLRTGWYQLKPGMMINQNLEDATNPFPTLFIITRGEGAGRLGEKEMDLREGMSIYVPAGMVHQFWTNKETGMEFVIIMFGEGA